MGSDLADTRTRMARPDSGSSPRCPERAVTASVDIAIPVYNEARALPGCVSVLRAYLTRHLPFEWTITIVDNGSTDGTFQAATVLAASDDRVRALRLPRPGRGRALRAAWTRSEARIVAYMDVDLSTDLDGLLPLLAPLASGHSDLAIGSRLAPGARTVRSLRRELISRGYNALIRLTHGVRLTDAQCGFKAARRAAVLPLLDRVQDDGWFFDTELLLLALHNGLRVYEVPVDWVEDPDSRVEVFATAWHDLQGLARLAGAKAAGHARVGGLPARPGPRRQHPDAVQPPAGNGSLRWQVLWFAVIGTVSTLLTAALYAGLRAWLPPLPANLGALTIATLLNTEANRRLTFSGVRGATAAVHLQGLVVFVLYYAFTSAALLALRAVVTAPARWLDVCVLLASFAVGTAGRFLLLRAWVFRPDR